MVTAYTIHNTPCLPVDLKRIRHSAEHRTAAPLQAVASRLQVDGAAVAARMGGLIAWKELKEPCYAPGLRITRTFSPTEAPVMTVALAALQKSEKLASTAAAAQLLIGTPGDMALLLPELQLQRVAGAEGGEVVLPAAQQGDAVGTDDADDDHQGFVASALQGIEGVEALEGLVLGEEMLGDAMQFQDGRVTHLLVSEQRPAWQRSQSMEAVGS